jgi:hypothetical protein
MDPERHARVGRFREGIGPHFLSSRHNPATNPVLTMLGRQLLALGLGLLVASVSTWATVPFNVLLYSATADFRHDSIPTAVAALQRAAPATIHFVPTEDEAQFRDATLSNFDAVLFLSTTGEGGYLLSCSTRQTDRP